MGAFLPQVWLNRHIGDARPSRMTGYADPSRLLSAVIGAGW
jgi:hypothetical protein